MDWVDVVFKIEWVIYLDKINSNQPNPLPPTGECVLIEYFLVNYKIDPSISDNDDIIRT